jgi:choline dehydrogenase-like flavoprotein
VTVVSDTERRTMELLAVTALPPGRILPGASAQTVARAERLLAELPEAIASGYRRLLLALDAQALLAFGARFARLPLGKRLDVLARLEKGEFSRLALRGLLAPLKLAHFDDPAVYAALGCRYAVEPPLRPERARWHAQVFDASTLPAGEALECDAVVVGTGAGGAPVAMALAARGHAVLLLEEGPLFTRQDFTGRALPMMKKLYRRAGATVAFGNTAIPIPLGRGVGGTTLINSGTCFRAPQAVLDGWAKEGLTALGGDGLSRYYDEVEEVLGVGPSSPEALGAPARLIARGCDALGWSHHPLRRNAPGCDGQGLCCFGCPTDAKRSTNVSFVPMALERGAQLITGFEAQRILTEGDRAVGVEGVCAQGTARLTIRAKVVVLACGALLTPGLLARNGLGRTSGQLGKNLSIHPAGGALGVFDEEVHAWRTVPQGYAIDEFTGDGLYFEGAQVPLELSAVSLTGFGPAYVALMERFNQSFTFGFLLKDSSRGRVTSGEGGAPRITYLVNERDRAKLQRGFALLARVFFAAGARAVYLPVLGFEELRSLADVERLERASVPVRHMDLTAYHPLGTARMGVDPLKSVVNPDHELHDLNNLFVCDGSVVPSSLGVNPQVTIMAMSLRAAEGIHRRLEQLAARDASAPLNA